MPDNGFVKVNIHNEGRIPWLNIQGPRYNISVSATIYRLLREDGRVVVHPVDNDPVMRAKEAAKKEEQVVVQDEVVVQATVDVEPEIVEEEVAEPEIQEEIVEEEVLDEVTEPDVIIEEEEEEVVEEITPEPEIREEQPIMQILEPDEEDLAIEQALEELPEEEEENIVITEEELIEEAQEISNFTVYTEDELLQLTKEQLKVILNEDRGFEPGTEFYGRYHDNHDVLVEKVLNSIKKIIERLSFLSKKKNFFMTLKVSVRPYSDFCSHPTG
jgi:hypothetical protein